MSPSEFQDRLIVFALVTGASTTSTGRTKQHNQIVGGVEHSAHRAWVAADVVYDSDAGRDGALEWARRLGLRLIREGDHDHLQPADWQAG